MSVRVRRGVESMPSVSSVVREPFSVFYERELPVRSAGRRCCSARPRRRTTPCTMPSSPCSGTGTSCNRAGRTSNAPCSTVAATSAGAGSSPAAVPHARAPRWLRSTCHCSTRCRSCPSTTAPPSCWATTTNSPSSRSPNCSTADRDRSDRGSVAGSRPCDDERPHACVGARRGDAAATACSIRSSSRPATGPPSTRPTACPSATSVVRRPTCSRTTTVVTPRCSPAVPTVATWW